jgi:hypothetical protein
MGRPRAWASKGDSKAVAVSATALLALVSASATLLGGTAGDSPVPPGEGPGLLDVNQGTTGYASCDLT